MSCFGAAVVCCCCYLCVIYPILVTYFALSIYIPCMTSGRFVATKCRVVDKSPGEDSVACNNIKVVYDDPRLEQSTSGTIGNLCPNEDFIEENGYV